MTREDVLFISVLMGVLVAFAGIGVYAFITQDDMRYEVEMDDGTVYPCHSYKLTGQWGESGLLTLTKVPGQGTVTVPVAHIKHITQI